MRTQLTTRRLSILEEDLLGADAVAVAIGEEGDPGASPQGLPGGDVLEVHVDPPVVLPRLGQGGSLVCTQTARMWWWICEVCER